MRKLLLKSVLSPGDAVVMTAAIKSLHVTYPSEYLTAVETSTNEIWENNPLICKPEEDFEKVDLHYELIHQSNQISNSFMQAYVDGLSKVIDRPLILKTYKPDLYLNDQEKSWINQIQQYFSHGRKIPFWVVNTGVKKDYTTKQWPVEFYQKIVDETAGYIQWVQVGSKEHEHHPMRGVISLLGKTSTREFIRLIYHCQGGLGPSTFLQHVCAAFDKPYICLLGGREPVPWVTYTKQHTLHTIGQFECCNYGACWKSRVIPLNDGDSKDQSLCNIPVLGMIKPAAKCMVSIKPQEVLSILERYYNNAI